MKIEHSVLKINMQRKLYLFILIIFCHISASANNLDVNIDFGMLGYAVQDTSKHRVFHSKFGDDVQFPALTGNAEENAAVLRNFFGQISRRKNIRIETFISLIPLMPKGGDDGTIETLTLMMPMTYRAFYSATMEYLLFRDMGGRNRTVQKIFAALRDEMSERFTPLCHRNPETYCAQLDSVCVFLKNLDYVGDIYPEIEGLKPREEQPVVVNKIVSAVAMIKENMIKNAEKDKMFRRLVVQLHDAPESVNLREYFTEDICKKFENNELNLKHISPDKEWTDWDVNNNELCSFSYEMNDVFHVILANKEIGDLLDSDTSRIVHSYYVTFVKAGDKWLICDLKVQDVYR